MRGQDDILTTTRHTSRNVPGGIPPPLLSRRKRLIGLDLGTSKVAVVIAEADEYGQLNIDGVGEVPAEGLRKGVVVNIERTVHAVQTAMVGAERMAGVRGEAVIVALAGPHINSQNSRGGIAVSRPDPEIVDEDLERVVEA